MHGLDSDDCNCGSPKTLEDLCCEASFRSELDVFVWSSDEFQKWLIPGVTGLEGWSASLVLSGSFVAVSSLGLSHNFHLISSDVIRALGRLGAPITAVVLMFSSVPGDPMSSMGDRVFRVGCGWCMIGV